MSVSLKIFLFKIDKKWTSLILIYIFSAYKKKKFSSQYRTETSISATTNPPHPAWHKTSCRPRPSSGCHVPLLIRTGPRRLHPRSRPTTGQQKKKKKKGSKTNLIDDFLIPPSGFWYVLALVWCARGAAARARIDRCKNKTVVCAALSWSCRRAGGQRLSCREEFSYYYKRPPVISTDSLLVLSAVRRIRRCYWPEDWFLAIFVV